MKFLYYPLGLELNLCDNKLNVLIIENPRALDKIVSDINEQLNSNNENCAVFNNTNQLDFHKTVDCVFSSVNLNFESKNLQKVLFQNLKTEIESSDIEDEFVQLRSEMIQFIEKIQMGSDFSIVADYEIDMIDLLKLFGITLNIPEGSFIGRLIDYLQMMIRLMGKRIFILIGCVNYIDRSELHFLFKFIQDSNVQILFIDYYDSPLLREFSNRFIIDSDLCEIA